MNEENIINGIDNLIQFLECTKYGKQVYLSTENKFKEALEGILDLYNKEKEKNNELEKDISEMYYKGVVLDILQDELNISRDEAIEILENY